MNKTYIGMKRSPDKPTRTRKKVVATVSRRERVYKRTGEPSVPFCDKGGMTERLTDFSVKKNRNGA